MPIPVILGTAIILTTSTIGARGQDRLRGGGQEQLRGREQLLKKLYLEIVGAWCDSALIQIFVAHTLVILLVEAACIGTSKLENTEMTTTRHAPLQLVKFRA